METIKSYPCPSCGAPLVYDGQTESLHCDSCENDFSAETLKNISDTDQTLRGESIYRWNDYTPRTFDEAEVKDASLCSYSCPACAAEITGDASMGATICPYCGNAAIVQKKFEGASRPDYVVPFKLDKKMAMEAFENACKKAPFLPDLFHDKRKLEEMSGIYIPFWMFDCKADAALSFRAERVHAWSDSRYNYVKTDHYKLFRAGNISFENMPCDASTKADDAFMDSLEPYDLSTAVDFNTAYLAGYLADKYDVTATECTPRANARIEKSTEKAFTDTATGYGALRKENAKISFSDSKIRYALLPVWMLNIAYEGEMYKYAVNGQTGKVVGKYPVCKKKRNLYFLKVLGIGVGIMAILALLLFGL